MSSRRTAQAAVAAHESWARTKDRGARTQPARDGRWRRYLERARELQGPDATPEAVEQAAEHLRQADMQRMALASARVRRQRLAQGLPETIEDHEVLDRVAAIIEASAAGEAS